jgi:putative YphP/YqiW family bacilliredoxin
MSSQNSSGQNQPKRPIMQQNMSQYPAEMVEPMRSELTSAGFDDLRSAEAVDALVKSGAGTVLLAVNSVCGCSAGAFRPGVKMALTGSKRPAKLGTVFAGVEKDATDRARSYMVGYPPSSPSAALFKDGKLVFMLERHEIQGHGPAEVAEKLSAAFAKYC